MDEDEKPLEGIIFHIDDIKNNYQKVGNPAISDNEGTASLSVWLPGCPSVKFVVYSEAPSDYELTTSARISARGNGTGQSFLFGYRYVPEGTPTPRPVPAKLVCARFSILFFEMPPLVFTAAGQAWTADETPSPTLCFLQPGVERSQAYPRDQDFLGFARVNELALGPDSSVWLATPSGVTQFTPQTGNWTSHTSDNGLRSGNASHIAVLPSRDVLVQTEAGIELLDSTTVTWRVLIEQTSLGELNGSRFLRRDKDVLFVSDDRILRFWRDEVTRDVKWGIFWSKAQSPEMPVEHTHDIAVEPDNTIWISGYDTRQGDVVAYLAPGASSWVTFTYRSTGGALGTSELDGIEVAPDQSIWLNEGMELVHGIAQDGNRTNMEWASYDQPQLGLDPELSGLSISDIAIAPDGALWFLLERRWYRCQSEGTRQ